MRTVEITRIGDASIADQIAEMHEWLRQAGIAPAELQPLRILNGNVRFQATFANADDAERFRTRFDAESGRSPASQPGPLTASAAASR